MQPAVTTVLKAELELKRETNDGVKAKRLTALDTKIKYAMANENLLVVVFKLPR